MQWHTGEAAIATARVRLHTPHTGGVKGYFRIKGQVDPEEQAERLAPPPPLYSGRRPRVEFLVRGLRSLDTC